MNRHMSAEDINRMRCPQGGNFGNFAKHVPRSALNPTDMYEKQLNT